MKKNWMLSLLFTLTCTGLTAQALADPIALIRQPEGKVFVNRVEDTVTAHAGMALHPGYRVITLADSRVAVVYPDECVIRLEENDMLTVNSAGECGIGMAQVRGVEPYQNQAVGQTPGGFSVGDAVILGTAGAMIGAVINKATDDDNDASPSTQ